MEKVSKEISQAYFESRPIGSQIGAAVSNQSQVIPNRGHLLDKEAQLKSVYGDGSQKMEKPEEWGGMCVKKLDFLRIGIQTHFVHRYSCNKITTTLIQISRLFYFGFFSKTNRQMMI